MQKPSTPPLLFFTSTIFCFNRSLKYKWNIFHVQYGAAVTTRCGWINWPIKRPIQMKYSRWIEIDSNFKTPPLISIAITIVTRTCFLVQCDLDLQFFSACKCAFDFTHVIPTRFRSVQEAADAVLGHHLKRHKISCNKSQIWNKLDWPKATKQT